jgi:hypothetical protein
MGRPDHYERVLANLNIAETAIPSYQDSALNWSCKSLPGHSFALQSCQEHPQRTDLRHCLGSFTMPIVWMRAAARCATPSAVQAANGPSVLRGASAALARTLGRGGASRRVSEALGGVCGVSVTFHCRSPLPPCVTSPTIACPPSFTVTRSTLTVCWALERYFLRASIWAM